MIILHERLNKLSYGSDPAARRTGGSTLSGKIGFRFASQRVITHPFSSDPYPVPQQPLSVAV